MGDMYRAWRAVKNSCKDGSCGASDCSRCFPGNDYEQEQQRKINERLEREGDEMRDRNIIDNVRGV